MERKVSDYDYATATPDRLRRSRLCHVNMLKPYHERENVRPCQTSISDVKAAMVLNTAASPAVLSTTVPVSHSDTGEVNPSQELSSAETCGVDGLSEAVVQGRLKTLRFC